jgi:hypothetical protein
MPGVQPRAALLKLYLIRGCGFVAAGMLVVVCATMAVVFALTAIAVGAENWMGCLFTAVVSLFTGACACAFAKVAVSALRYRPPPASRRGDGGGDDTPPPYGLGVPASLGPRGPKPLVARARVA